jgi:hypothetical protein
MAPGFEFEITRISLVSCSTTSGLYAYSAYEICSPSRPVETKKERQQRVAKELMYASWQVYNQISMTVKKVIQICKPEHKLFKT